MESLALPQEVVYCMFTIGEFNVELRLVNKQYNSIWNELIRTCVGIWPVKDTRIGAKLFYVTLHIQPHAQGVSCTEYVVDYDWDENTGYMCVDDWPTSTDVESVNTSVVVPPIKPVDTAMDYYRCPFQAPGPYHVCSCHTSEYIVHDGECFAATWRSWVARCNLFIPLDTYMKFVKHKYHSVCKITLDDEAFNYLK